MISIKKTIGKWFTCVCVNNLSSLPSIYLTLIWRRINRKFIYSPITRTLYCIILLRKERYVSKRFLRASEMDISGDKVPRRPLAKLMFYLRAVSHCVDIEDLCDVRRWTDFPHYHLLTGQEADGVARLCFALSPDVLRLKCFKENDSNSGGFDTVFYETDHAKTRWDHAVSDSITLRGSILRVTRVMECRTEWLQEFYYQPIKHYEHVMEGAKMTFRLESSSPRLARNSQTTYGTFCTASCVWRTCSNEYRVPPHFILAVQDFYGSECVLISISYFFISYVLSVLFIQ